LYLSRINGNWIIRWVDAMKFILNSIHKPLFWVGFRVVLLIALSSLSACNEIGPAAEIAPAKTTAIAATPTYTIELPGDSTPKVDVITRYSFPEWINPEDRYLIYLHGRIIENEGIYAISPEFGPYEYVETLKYFADEGFNVISEVRPANTDDYAYADRVVDQINILLEGGVPAENITVVGFSKGGGIAIFTSSKLRNPDANFVLIAICGDEINKIPRASLTGRILSLYEKSDEYGSSCKSLVERSPNVTGFEEIEFSTGLRHGAFYTADPIWLEPLISWLNEGGR
jgi:hypothetical protein